ncbi:DUF6875 domain-containing protein [Streptomyces nitrosporeus]|uniref:DUF6875 domain-containing protein n=1 Tax=Streptomyces nitrosporeus TaxID=28894 RepID=UPI0039A3C653
MPSGHGAATTSACPHIAMGEAPATAETGNVGTGSTRATAAARATDLARGADGEARSGATPADDAARTEAVVRGWLESYIAQPHEELGRNGPVCPFVAPALKAGTLILRSRLGMAHTDAHGVRAVVRDMVHDFRSQRWPQANPTMRTLLLVLPDLPPAGWPLLDAAQAECKRELARAGLMLGQFHPACPEPAARNPRFPVSRSPVPVLALRNMAVHDVLFLHQDRAFFAEYRRLFGSRHERGVVADPLLRSTYRDALARHAPSPSSTESRPTNGETA